MNLNLPLPDPANIYLVGEAFNQVLSAKLKALQNCLLKNQQHESNICFLLQTTFQNFLEYCAHHLYKPNKSIKVIHLVLA